MTKSRFIGREREIKEDRVIKNDITHITYIDIDNLYHNRTEILFYWPLQNFQL